MTNYDSSSLCHLADIFFAMHAGAKELIFSKMERAPYSPVRLFRHGILLDIFMIHDTTSSTNCHKYNRFAYDASFKPYFGVR